MKNKLLITTLLLSSLAAHAMDGSDPAEEAKQQSQNQKPSPSSADAQPEEIMNEKPHVTVKEVFGGAHYYDSRAYNINYHPKRPQDDPNKSTASKIAENFNEGFYKGIESAPQVAIQTAVSLLTKEAVAAAFSAVKDFFYKDDANRRIFVEKLEALNTDGQHLQLVAKIISKQLSDLDDLIENSNNTRLKKVYQHRRQKIEKDLEKLLLTSLSKLQKQTLELIKLKSNGATEEELALLNAVEDDQQPLTQQQDEPKTPENSVDDMPEQTHEEIAPDATGNAA